MTTPADHRPTVVPGHPSTGPVPAARARVRLWRRAFVGTALTASVAVTAALGLSTVAASSGDAATTDDGGGTKTTHHAGSHATSSGSAVSGSSSSSSSSGSSSSSSSSSASGTRVQSGNGAPQATTQGS